MGKFIKHIPCPKCGSSDGNSLYEDGSSFCFVCHTNFRKEETKVNEDMMDEMSTFEHTENVLKTRKINSDTTRFYGVMEGSGGVVSFPYAEGRTKVRTPDKKFRIIGGKLGSLFGQNLFQPGKVVCITEGEFDALSAYQMLSATVPCVSVPNGATAALKDCQAAFEWLDGFESVVIAFDKDEPGQKAAQEVCELFGAKAKVVSFENGYKDANDYLMGGSQAKFVKAFWAASPYRPEGIVGVGDIKERLLTPPKPGIPWCFPAMTALTHGRRLGELYGFGAGVGVGKTDLFTQSIAYDIGTLNEAVGVIYLEQPVTETVQRVCGKLDGVPYHVPGSCVDPLQFRQSIERLESSNKLWLFEHFGSKEWGTIKAKIRYMSKALGIRMIYLDHLTALTADLEDERRGLDKMMADMASLAQELGVIIHFISHLTTPQGGASHEEGARVKERDFTGSRAIARWAHFLVGLERNKQHEDEVMRQVTTVRILKDRYTGQATGQTFYLRYDPKTGTMSEVPFQTEKEEVL